MKILFTILSVIVAYIVIGVLICIGVVKFGLVNPYEEEEDWAAAIVLGWLLFLPLAIVYFISQGFTELLKKIYDEREKDKEDTDDE